VNPSEASWCTYHDIREWARTNLQGSAVPCRANQNCTDYVTEAMVF